MGTRLINLAGAGGASLGGRNALLTTPPYDDYLHFTFSKEGQKLGWGITGHSTLDINVMYSRDDGATWTAFPERSLIRSAHAGDRVCVKNTTNTFNTSSVYATFYVQTDDGTAKEEGPVYVGGNVMSLVNNSALSNFCFKRLFSSMWSLRTAPNLPETNLADGCYYEMFHGCWHLQSPPSLPATVMAGGCYWGMFQMCIEMAAAPVLNVDTLAASCFRYMFYGCRYLRVSEDGGVGQVFLNLPSGTATPTAWASNMLLDTGGTFTTAPQVGKPYYFY